ncbi:hypothetical protein PCASD_03621 [Puccinia coronata f. sp. avenae]|uniref:Uncharacterized protein n=1 Tax=Puccinia coronata f. sp. avenae TaxID=200324 RepID=A0A2N5VDH3_9BASI|nr:hypothetical protein PCASD_03621 [Puccinia coronata f. sp. avenae]
MSDSTDSLTATPPESTHSASKAIRKQRGLVYLKFRNLRNKSDHYAPWNSSYPIVHVDTDQDTWNEACHRLQFKVLPSLRQQINTLPKLLNPPDLQDDILNGSKLKLITEIQSELDHSLDQMLSISAGIRLRPIPSPADVDDKDLKEMKEFTRRGVFFKLHSLNHALRFIFDLSSVANSIDDLIKWLASHEFINIQEQWGPELSSHEGNITQVTKLINEAIHQVDVESTDDGEESADELIIPDLDKRAIPLAESLIPVIKLSRLFFRKLARDGLHQIPLKSFTNMNSYQLETLSESAGFIACDFSDIIRFLKGSNENDETETADFITEIIRKLIHRFDSNLLLAIMYIIPLIPNSINSPSCLQNYLVMWNNLFLIATHRCIRAAQSYKADSQPVDTDE